MTTYILILYNSDLTLEYSLLGGGHLALRTRADSGDRCRICRCELYGAINTATIQLLYRWLPINRKLTQETIMLHLDPRTARRGLSTSGPFVEVPLI